VADTVLLLHRPDYHDPSDRPGLIEVEVAKARDGERGVVVNLRNDYAHMRALDWEGDVPMRQVLAPAKRWGKGTGVAA
jgi:replicative DNA helicase